MAPMAPKDIYMKQFSRLGRGVALYEPTTVHVGDVGFINPQNGSFCKLYNIDDPPRNDKPGCPSPIKLGTASHSQEWDAIHVCYLLCFALKTLPDFVIVLAEEIKGFGSLIASNRVGQAVAVHRPVTEICLSAPKVKWNLYSQKSRVVNAS
jgi:hypothetical protein